LFGRFIDLDVVIAVQDQPPSKQDINKSSFNVVTPTRAYELMAHDEEEKLRYRVFYACRMFLTALAVGDTFQFNF